MGPEARLLITVVADALISAHHILANAVRAYTAGSRAFIDVLASLLVGAQLVPRGTLTAKATFGINASTAATQTRRLFAFIYVHANLHNVIAAITRGTIALEIAGRISASTVTANTVHNLAFVDIVALDAMLVEREALIASTAVTADRIFASAV